jgi:hypothetical protein
MSATLDAVASKKERPAPSAEQATAEELVDDFPYINRAGIVAALEFAAAAARERELPLDGLRCWQGD